LYDKLAVGLRQDMWPLFDQRGQIISTARAPCAAYGARVTLIVFSSNGPNWNYPPHPIQRI